MLSQNLIMIDLIKKIHKRNPFIKYYIFTFSLICLVSLPMGLIRNYHYNVHIEYWWLMEIIALSTKFICYVFCLYVVDWVFIQSNKSFLKRKTLINYFILLVICYIFTQFFKVIAQYLVDLYLIKDLSHFKFLNVKMFFYEISQNPFLLFFLSIYILITRFLIEPYQVYCFNQNNPINNLSNFGKRGGLQKDRCENKKQRNKGFLKITKNERTYNVSFKDILFIKAAGNYMEINCTDRIFPLRISLTKIKTLLPDTFFQIHRSVIINLDAVKSLKYNNTKRKYIVEMNDNSNHHVSASHLANIKIAQKLKQLS